MSDDERRKLVSTEQSLTMEPEPRVPTAISGLETFTLGDDGDKDEETEDAGLVDADSFFNLPKSGEDAETKD